MTAHRAVFLFGVLLVLAAVPVAQDPGSSPPPSLPALAQRLEAEGGSWLPIVTRSSLTVGLRRLAAGEATRVATDGRDRVLYVLRGPAQEIDGSAPARSLPDGALVEVAAGALQRIRAVDDPVWILEITAPSPTTRGGMAAGPAPTEQTPYDEHSERGQARIFYWFGDGSAGQCVIDHGRPEWHPAHARWLDGAGPRRWRFGENFWTTLDTNIPLTVGGVRLEPGLHYLVLERPEPGRVRMVALDPDTIRARRLDAYEADETEGGTTIPLTRTTDGAATPRLDVALTVRRDAERSNGDRGDLVIAFGPLRLRAPVVLHPDH